MAIIDFFFNMMAQVMVFVMSIELLPGLPIWTISFFLFVLTIVFQIILNQIGLAVSSPKQTKK